MPFAHTLNCFLQKTIIYIFPSFSFINRHQRRNVLGRIGGPSISDRTMQSTWRRSLIVSSCAKEQIEESVNMLFVIYAMKAFKNGEEIKGASPKWRRIDEDLSSWNTKSSDNCGFVVVYQRLFGWSKVVGTCQGLCFLWKNVHCCG